MTRSKLRKIRRENLQLLKHGIPIAGAMLAGAGVVHAQQPDETSGLEEVVVSAQKRNESLQDVPLSIQAIGEKELGQLKVDELAHYRSKIELDTMRSIKRALDPQNIMNPGKVIRV